MFGEKQKEDLTIGVVMPVHNCLEYTKRTFESFRTKYKHFWIIIDNGSTDGTAEWLDEWVGHVDRVEKGKWITLHTTRYEENKGVAESWNQGIAQALTLGADVVFVINNDLVFAEDTVDNLMRWYLGSMVVSVTSVGSNPEALARYQRQNRALRSPTFIGFLIDEKVIKRVGWFDEEYRQAYFEDDDYIKRCEDEEVMLLQALDAPVVHFGSRTRREGGVNHEPFSTDNRRRFKSKHGFEPDVVGGFKGRLLWIGDASDKTGFGRVTFNVLKHLWKDWDVHHLGSYYFGDPHGWPWPTYPALIGGDDFGVKRYAKLVQGLEPDVVFFLNDFHIVSDLIREKREYERNGGKKVPLVAYVPVDARNLNPKWVDDLTQGVSSLITYTEFGAKEFRKSGYNRSIEIIPHGVTSEFYAPEDQLEARRKLRLPWSDEKLMQHFWIGNVNNNQPRKRQDLTLKFFADWLNSYETRPKAILYLHCKVAGVGYEIPQLAKYYGIDGHVIVLSDDIQGISGVPEENMRWVYSCLDLQVSTTMGEGWGLTALEGMACGVPQLLPNHSAFSEWAVGAAELVSCIEDSVTPGGINTVGRVVDGKDFVSKLDSLYNNRERLKRFSDLGLRLAEDRRFSWSRIASQFDRVLVRTMRNAEVRPQDSQPKKEVGGTL